MVPRNARIVVVGAGPSGLLSAHYLTEAGYSNVVVLEKQGRVGGMVHSVMAEGRSFDLGANYFTPAYRTIRKLARRLGAKSNKEEPFVAMQVPEDPTQPVSFSQMITAFRNVDGKQVSGGEFFRALFRYLRIRRKLSPIIDRPSFAGVEKHPELCVPLDQWLKANNLTSLKSLFELPITLMGYGYVSETSAIYALKFITPATFVPMVIKRMPFIGRYYPWPRRFSLGFQRLWEQLSWNLNLRLNVDIERIQRSAGEVTISFTSPENELNGSRRRCSEITADHLILACPQTLDVLGKFLDVSPAERSQFEPVKTNSYCVTTYPVKGLKIGGDLAGVGPMAAVLPVAPLGTVWGVAKQYKDCDVVQFYSQIDPRLSEDEGRDLVIANVQRTIKQMGGEVCTDRGVWNSYNRWPYFQHVSAALIQDGFYSRLEALQGQQQTYYVGGVTNFQLIEPIAQYAEHVVDTYFLGRRPAMTPAL